MQADEISRRNVRKCYDNNDDLNLGFPVFFLFCLSLFIPCFEGLRLYMHYFSRLGIYLWGVH